MFFSGGLTSSEIVDRLIFTRAVAPLCAFSDPEYITTNVDLHRGHNCALHLVAAGFIPTKADLNRIQKCAIDLATSGLILDDSRDLTVEAIAADARDNLAEAGIGFIVIDHLHLIRSESTRPGTPRKCEMARVIREIRSLAQELGLPVLVSAHLKRRADGRLPRIGDIRESGAIEHEADFVGLLHREGPIADENYFNLLIAKNYNGPTRTVSLFRPPGLQWFEQGQVHNEEEEMERAWRDYRNEKDYPPEIA